MDKVERRIQVNTIGNETEEGRLKIKKIEEFRRDSNVYKINSILLGILGAFEILVGLIGEKISLRDISILTTITMLSFISFVHKKMITDNKIYNLEEEILNQKVR